MSYTKESITSIIVKNTSGSGPKSSEQTDTTYQSLLTITQPPGSGSEANGSSGCESFTQGKTTDGKSHMIFSQTGSALLD